MAIIAQNSFTIKRLEKPSFEVDFTPETMAIPASSSGVADLTNAEFEVKVKKEGKEVFPNWDESLGARNLIIGASIPEVHSNWNEFGWSGSFTVVEFEGESVYKLVAENGWHSARYPISFSDHVTVSFEAYLVSEETTSSGSKHIGISASAIGHAGSGVTPTDNTWTKVTKTLLAENGRISICVKGVDGSGTKVTYLIRDLKVVRGEHDNVDNVPLMAPEDALRCAELSVLNCSAAVIGSKLKLTTLTPDTTQGYVDALISYGQFSQLKRFTWVRLKEGTGISTVKNYYLATNQSTGVTRETSGWTEEVQTPTSSKKYLWNYEEITKTDTSKVYTTPTIIGNYSADGSAGKGISEITEYFQVNNSSTQPPTTWSTTPQQTSTTNRYLWNYERIDYTDGTYKETGKRVISVHGLTGATGRGLLSIVEQYYLSTSKTSQTGGSWQNTPPQWTEDKYMWRRQLISYDDSTSETTTPYLDSSWESYTAIAEMAGSKNKIWSTPPTNSDAYNIGDIWLKATIGSWVNEQLVCKTAKAAGVAVSASHWELATKYTDDTAVNNMNIGSRNLLKNSKAEVRNTSYLIKHYYLGDVKPQEGQQVTIMFKGELGEGKTKFGLYQGGGSIGITDIYPTNRGDDGIWKKTFNWRIQAGSNSIMEIYQMPNTVTAESWISEIMLVIGNKVAYYSEAPEDVQARITDAKQAGLDAQASANTANTAVSNLNTYVDGAFKDGVISESEAKAIEKYINIVNTEKAGLEAHYNKLYQNTYLEGTPKTNLLNAKITYFGAVDNLLSAINTAISDGKVTPAEKSNVDVKYSQYKTDLASFQSAIEDANKAIQDKLDELSTGKVANLQIGGENLLPFTDFTEGTKGVQALGDSTLWVDEHGRLKVGADTGIPGCALLDVSVEAGVEYVFQIERWWVDFTNVLFFYGSSPIHLTEIKREPVDSPAGENGVRVFYSLYSHSAKSGEIRLYTGNTGGEFRIRYPQLQKGNKPTPYQKSLKYLAEAFSGSVDIAGALLAAKLILMKNNQNIITAGMSGLDDNILLFGGGSYQQALGEITPTLLKKDGGGYFAHKEINWDRLANIVNIGIFQVNRATRIVTVLSNDKTRNIFVVGEQNIPTLDSLLNATSETGSVYPDDYSHSQWTMGASYILPTSLVVPSDGTNITINAQVSMTCNASATPPVQGQTPRTSYQLYLCRKDGSDWRYEYPVADNAINDGSANNTITKVLPGCPAGEYRLGIAYTIFPEGQIVVSSVSLSRVKNTNVRRTEIGENGMFSFFSKNGKKHYLHIDEDNGVKMGGDIDMPGVLAAGSVAENGAQNTYRAWGAKVNTNPAQRNGAIYTVPHNIGHPDFIVQVTSHVPTRIPFVTGRTSTTFTVKIYDQNNTPQTSGFDYVLIGKN